MTQLAHRPSPPAVPDHPVTRPRTRPVTLSPGLIIAGLLGGVAAASGIALTTTSGWLIVRADEQPQILLLITAIVAVRTFGLARPVFRYWERLRSHDAALTDLAERRTSTYAVLVPLTPARLGARGRSDLLTGVVDDLTDVVDASVRVTVPVLGALVAGVGAAALTALVHPGAGLVLAGMLLAVAGVAFVADRLESRTQREVLDARAEAARVAQLTAEHADELRSIGGVNTATGWLREAHHRVRVSVARQSRGRALSAAAVLVITGVATLTTAVLAAGSDASGPVRGLLVLAPVATGEALGVLTEATRSLARARACGQRLDALLDQSPAVVEPAANDATPLRPGGTPRLAIDRLSAAWLPGRTHLGPLDLVIEPGERVAITGPNGSGKSTLLAVLARHLDPTTGTYTVDGVDVTRVPLEHVRSLIALVDDEPHVLAASLRANLALAAPGATDDLLEAALRRAGLGIWFDGLPDGLDSRLGAGGLGISGGERTRLAIARAIASDRPVILLDEPVAHLDHPTAHAVIDDLVHHVGEKSVIMVTHHGIGLERMDRIVSIPGTEG
ncbi:thiol reductant ABC exporter subunit CydC [Janibacter cremeus]|uniref:Thiol reductant ABC exporter CydC subunit n=1 Tax=Janibacter cremeus TaxID=1285192 RepID=A0A852VWH9_9MICO|nr:thiol reductant ABC exporter subunit CydC [Janibacter cremeus]NYF98614.1 thiol reductant ABC exporter CydC subunit [Janibacter cremeus]